ncbi:MAG: peroxiredoxin [Pseudolabrys sp.]
MPIALPATEVIPVNLSKLRGRTVVYVYRRTGVPDPGARGCTPQSCSFHDHFGELTRLGVAQLYGLSTQNTAYQKEAATRLHLPFAILSDEKLTLTRALNLPTFSTELKRMALVIDDNTITKVFYPVFPPDKNAAEVIAWLQRSR